MGMGMELSLKRMNPKMNHQQKISQKSNKKVWI